MKKLLVIAGLLSIFAVGAQADRIDDLFGGGESTEFDFERNSSENIWEAITHDAGLLCKDGLCKLTSTKSKYREFTLNMNGGIGNNSSGGFGGFGDGGGTTINLGNNNGGGSLLERMHAGINMQVKVGDCVKEVNVPRALFYSINRYIYGLLNEDGTTRRTFTPADEAMIMFYTTVMKMADTCVNR